MKPHKGILKRMRITKTGKVKHKSANSKHLKSAKSPKRLRRLRKDRYVSAAEANVLEMLLNRRIRGRDQPRTALRRSPSPAESAKIKAEKAAARKAAAAAPK
jgi:large subunit ribosomal protein L35